MAEQTLSNQPNSGPVGGDEALSFDEGVSSLETLVDPDVQDNPKAVEEDTKNEAEDDVEEQPEEDSEDEDTPDDTGEEDEEDSTEESEETEEENEDVIAYADDVVVELEGEQTTLGEIVDSRLQERVKSFQADYTRKTQEVAEERRVIDSQTEKLVNIAEQTKQQRDTFLAFQRQFAPDPPDVRMVDTDPAAYQRHKAYYDEWMNGYNQFEQESQRYNLQQHQEMQQQQEMFLEDQKRMMVETLPELGTEEGFIKFKEDLGEYFIPYYGYSVEELNQVTDHRFAKLAKDAMSYRQLKGTAPETRKKLEGKPKILKPGAKKVSKKVTASKARQDRLAKTGELDAAIDALMDFDL